MVRINVYRNQYEPVNSTKLAMESKLFMLDSWTKVSMEGQMEKEKKTYWDFGEIDEEDRNTRYRMMR